MHLRTAHRLCAIDLRFSSAKKILKDLHDELDVSARNDQNPDAVLVHLLKYNHDKLFAHDKVGCGSTPPQCSCVLNRHWKLCAVTKRRNQNQQICHEVMRSSNLKDL